MTPAVARVSALTGRALVGETSAFTSARTANMVALKLLQSDGAISPQWECKIGDAAGFYCGAVGSPGAVDAVSVALYSVANAAPPAATAAGQANIAKATSARSLAMPLLQPSRAATRRGGHVLAGAHERAQAGHARQHTL